MPRITLRVSGTVFEMDSQLLKDKEGHTLTKLFNEADSSEQLATFNFNRPVDSFTAILSYYQTGQLHMPNHVCPRAFKLELDYWNIPTTELQKCCLFKYYGFMDELDTYNRFINYEKGLSASSKSPPVYTFACLSSCRRKLWNIIDFQENTAAAKVYLGVVLMMVLGGILVLGLQTVPSLQRQANTCEMLDYLYHTDTRRYKQLHKEWGNPNCIDYHDDYEYGHTSSTTAYPSSTSSEATTSILGISTSIPVNNTSSTHGHPAHPPKDDTDDKEEIVIKAQILVPDFRMPLFGLEVADMIVAAFFTIDFILRLFACPSFRMFLLSVSNICDFVALVGFYVYMLVTNTHKTMKYDRTTVRFIEFLQLFRTMRLFSVVRTLRASRVLVYSLRKNAKDMGLLLLFLIVVMSLSSCLMYFVEPTETLVSIPNAWYWSVITITTVGYGDLSPSTTTGKVVASVLAVCGILLLAITLPMFVNNFLALYQYSCLKDYVAEKCQQPEVMTKGQKNAKTITMTRIVPL